MSGKVNKRIYDITLHETGTTRTASRFKIVAKSFASALEKANKNVQQINKSVFKGCVDDINVLEKRGDLSREQAESDRKSLEPYCEVGSVMYLDDVE